MFGLTRQQRQALYVVFLLLLLGWAVKAWRTAHPPTVARTDSPLPSNDTASVDGTLPANDKAGQK